MSEDNWVLIASEQERWLYLEEMTVLILILPFTVAGQLTQSESQLANGNLDLRGYRSFGLLFYWRHLFTERLHVLLR